MGEDGSGQLANDLPARGWSVPPHEEYRMDEKRKLAYNGEGGALLLLYIRCFLLTMVTFGIYGTWAKARILKYHYGNTSFDGSAFGFNGTGKELFIGMLKGIGILLVVILPFIVFITLSIMALVAGDMGLYLTLYGLGFLFYIAGLILVMPLAINSSMRYRFGRTSWRSIRWAYAGKNREFLPMFVKGSLLTMVTLGIYGSWLQARLNSYMYSKLHFGSVRFRFTGEGKELFFINLKGLLLSAVTLGIYFFWYLRNVYRWQYENIEVIQGDRAIPLTVDLSGGGLFKLMLTNLLLVVFTLGIATPWVTVRTNRFIMANIGAVDDLDTTVIEQPSAEAGSDATGEELGDIFDFGDWGIL
jgi:uncharacterized membrane protein YjgN (DUF898 family)